MLSTVIKVELNDSIMYGKNLHSKLLWKMSSEEFEKLFFGNFLARI